MDIRNESLNLLQLLSNAVGAEYDNQSLALSIVEETFKKALCPDNNCSHEEHLWYNKNGDMQCGSCGNIL